MFSSFFKTRAFIILLVIIASLVFYLVKPEFLQQVELKFIDAKFRMRGPLKPGDDIVIVAIDKKSISDYGSWPWKRETIARLINVLHENGARVIGLDMLFASPSREPGSDARLVEAIAESGRVVSGFFFCFAPSEATFQSVREFEEALDTLSPFKIPVTTNISGRDIKPHLFEAFAVEPNIAPINEALAGCGHYNVYLERDGSARHIPLVVQAREELYPNFAVAVLKEYYGAKNLAVVFAGEHSIYIELGPLKIPTDGNGQIFTNYYGPNQTFTTYPAWKILTGEVPESAIRGKIVVVGGTSTGDFETRVSPFAATLSSVELEATIIDNLMHARYIREAPETIGIAIASIVLLPVALGLLMPRSGKSVLGMLVALGLTAAFLILNFYLFAVRYFELTSTYPLLAIFFTYLGVSVHSAVLHESRSARLRETVYQMGKAISEILDIEQVLPRILNSAIRVFGADRGMLLTTADGEREDVKMQIRCCENMTGVQLDSGEFSYGLDIISEVRSKKESKIVKTAKRKNDLASVKAAGEAFHPLVYCSPLIYRKRLLGIIYLESDSRKSYLWEEDMKIVDSFAAQASIAIENASIYSRLRGEEQKLKEENIYLKKEIAGTVRFESIVGGSKPLVECLKLVAKAAASEITVLIEGETGTGKELVARAVHFSGNRRNAMFVAQNCSALPESLLESELFGHLAGSFTGATQDKKGLFEIADNGTVFLDEVGDMSARLQAKLLRFLQEGMMRRVGGLDEKRVNVRVISATNKDLAEEVKAGRFREDLFYRLNALTIRVPTLRERKADIPLLVTHFINKATKKLNRRVKGISNEALSILVAYDFPGNIRELENEVEKAVVLTEPEGLITSHELSPRIMESAPKISPGVIPEGELSLKKAMEFLEREWIVRAINKHSGNKSRAARELGISRKGLLIRLKRHNISP